MPSRDYFEDLWKGVLAGALPYEWQLRRDFLLANVASGESVLDLGCGEGRFAAELARVGATVTAVDIAEEPLRRARRHHPDLDLRLIAAEGAWELSDACFDVVWAGEVIEHVADTAGWLSELRRVLRPGGRLLLSTPSLGRPSLLAAALSAARFARRFDPRGEDLRFYSRATLRSLIEDFGFEDVRVRGAGGPPAARRVLLASAVRSRW